MRTRVLLIALAALLTTSCGGGDKHLPSSNPPEYDPSKDYTSPRSRVSEPATEPARSTVPQEPPIALPSLEPGPDEKGEWRQVPMKRESLQQLKSAKTVCDALSQLVHGLGSAQLFVGVEGQVLKQSLGSQAESFAQSLDQLLFDSFKAQLGPIVADCPSPLLAHKSSGLEEFFPSGRVVRTNGLSNESFQLAQAPAVPASEDDYTETKRESRQEAPPGWVGWKTTTRTTRIGNKRETAGNSRSIVMILGGKVLKCPTPDGVVAGDFEFAVALDQIIVESGATRTVHIGLHASATLKGQVGDDAKVQYVEGDLSTVAERNGTDVPTSLRRRRAQFRFTLSRDDFYPGFPTNITPISETSRDIEGATPQENNFASDAAAAVMLWGGQNYLNAEKEWFTLNTCVEILFTPPTKTKKFVPNESTPVKTELRTKKEQTVVPAKFKEAKEKPREGNGNVSPRQAESQPGAPATFTSKAPATRVRHSGFRVKAVSRAGVAEEKEGEWELAPAAYVLEFKSHIVQEPLNLVNPQFGMQMSSNGFDAHVEATVPLRRRENDGQWVGEGVMQYATRTMTQPAQCEIRIQGTGTTTFHVNGGSISTDPEPFAVNVTILPGQSGEVAETHCTSANTPEKLKELFASQGVQGGEAHGVTKGGGWSSAFSFTRFRTFNWNKKGYEIGGWTQVLNSDVVAKKTMRINCSTGMQTCQEETTLILRLADEPDTAASPPR